jgi:predicted dehydrogenase
MAEERDTNLRLGDAGERAHRRHRLGMVGGGDGAFIGAVHRAAARLDDRYELIATSLSSDPVSGAAAAAQLHIDPERVYDTYTEMAETEAARDDGIDVVTIVTPNILHHPIAKAFLEAGVHVICDKPLTTTVADAEELCSLADASDLILAVTYNYTGYAMVREARELISRGAIGTPRVLQVRYAQDWLTTKLEETGHKQALWRENPAIAGPGGCLGDIGTHAYNLACFVLGEPASSLSADLSTFVDGRAVDDNVHVMLRYDSGCRGMLWASQVAPGNDQRIEIGVFGDQGGIEWSHLQPDLLNVTTFGEPPRVIQRGSPAMGGAAARVTRVPAGLPEGYYECFANLYRDIAAQLSARVEGVEADPASLLVPDGNSGLEAVRFVAAAVESNNANASWKDLL